MEIFLVIYASILTPFTVWLLYRSWGLVTRNDLLEEVINRFYSRTVLTIKLMRMFDERQMFESDDEVGETFKQLHECTEDLYTYVTEIRDGAIEFDDEE